MSERDEKNRRLAEWVGWQINQAAPGLDWFHIKRPDGALIASAMLEFVSIHVPDFYRSEEASALLLDQILLADSGSYQMCFAKGDIELRKSEWNGEYDERRGRWEFKLVKDLSEFDRKTAIAEAALLLAERGGQ